MLAALVGVVGTILVVGLLIDPPSAVVARAGIAGDTGSGVEEIRVQCRVWGASDRSVWGGAAGAVCQDAAPRRLVVVGVVATVTGTVVLILTARRRWEPPAQGRAELPRGLERAAASVLVALGLTAAGGGLAMQLVPDEITRLTTDERELVRALSADGQVLASFEAVGLGTAQGGRYEEELWIIVETPTLDGEDADAMVAALAQAGWSVEAVPPDHREGWVAFRGLAGQGSVDQVEIGLLRHAASPAAELSQNARRLLDTTTPADTGAVAVRLSPSPLAV